MMKPYALLLSLACTTTLHAQNWEVGMPVDVQISTITAFGGGCSPGPQATLFMPLLPVDGITYYYEVINTNGGTYTMVPGPANVLNVGDTVHFPITQITEVYNAANQGGLELVVHAEGIPTTPGQTHPCASNDIWMSDFQLCNEGLTSVISLGCETQPSTVGIDEANTALSFIAPLASNGFVLQVLDAQVRTVRVLDAQGRVVSTSTVATPRMDLNSQPDGVYLLQAERSNGEVRTHRFVLSR
ncbi:MAG: T9SS type A sorting domain-containing protein [Flavobacteriales bacterium]|nr:T9SS type A sorting domain-containing protein [Flavobacteriales bacterium]